MKFSLAAPSFHPTGPCENDPSLLGLLAPMASASEEADAGFASMLNLELSGAPAREPAGHEPPLLPFAPVLRQPDLRREVAGKLVPIPLPADPAAGLSPNVTVSAGGATADSDELDASVPATPPPTISNSPSAAVLGALQVAALTPPVVEPPEPPVSLEAGAGEAATTANAEGKSGYAPISPPGEPCAVQCKQGNPAPQAAAAPVSLPAATQRSVPAGEMLKADETGASKPNLGSTNPKAVELPRDASPRMANELWHLSNDGELDATEGSYSPVPEALAEAVTPPAGSESWIRTGRKRESFNGLMETLLPPAERDALALPPPGARVQGAAEAETSTPLTKADEGLRMPASSLTGDATEDLLEGELPTGKTLETAIPIPASWLTKGLPTRPANTLDPSRAPVDPAAPAESEVAPHLIQSSAKWQMPASARTPVATDPSSESGEPATETAVTTRSIPAAQLVSRPPARAATELDPNRAAADSEVATGPADFPRSNPSEPGAEMPASARKPAASGSSSEPSDQATETPETIRSSPVVRQVSIAPARAATDLDPGIAAVASEATTKPAAFERLNQSDDSARMPANLRTPVASGSSSEPSDQATETPETIRSSPVVRPVSISPARAAADLNPGLAAVESEATTKPAAFERLNQSDESARMPANLRTPVGTGSSSESSDQAIETPETIRSSPVVRPVSISPARAAADLDPGLAAVESEVTTEPAAFERLNQSDDSARMPANLRTPVGTGSPSESSDQTTGTLEPTRSNPVVRQVSIPPPRAAADLDPSAAAVEAEAPTEPGPSSHLNQTEVSKRTQANSRPPVASDPSSESSDQPAGTLETTRSSPAIRQVSVPPNRAATDLDPGLAAVESKATTEPAEFSLLNQSEDSKRMPENSRPSAAAGSGLDKPAQAAETVEAPRSTPSPRLATVATALPATDQPSTHDVVSSNPVSVSSPQPAPAQPTQPATNNRSRKAAEAEVSVTSRPHSESVPAEDNLDSDSPAPRAEDSLRDRPGPPPVTANIHRRRNSQWAADAEPSGQVRTANDGLPDAGTDKAGSTQVNLVRALAASDALKAELSGRDFSAAVVTAGRARKLASGQEPSVPEQSHSVRWAETEVRPMSTLPLAGGNLGKSWLAQLRPDAAPAEVMRPGADAQESSELVVSAAAPAKSSSDPAAQSAPSPAVTDAKARPASRERENGVRAMTERNPPELAPTTVASPAASKPAEPTPAPATPRPRTEGAHRGTSAPLSVRPETPRPKRDIQPAEPQMRTGADAQRDSLPVSETPLPSKPAVRGEFRPVSNAREAVRVQEPSPAKTPVPNVERTPAVHSSGQTVEPPVSIPANSPMVSPAKARAERPVGRNGSEDREPWRPLLQRAATPLAHTAPPAEAEASAVLDAQGFNNLQPRIRTLLDEAGVTPLQNAQPREHRQAASSEGTKSPAQAAHSPGEVPANAANQARTAADSQVRAETALELPPAGSSEAEPAGITTAQSVQRMNKQEKNTKPAAGTEQIMPGTVIPAGTTKASGAGSIQTITEATEVKRAAQSLPDDRMVTGMYADSVARPVKLEDSILPRAELLARRAITVETAELIADHALQLRQLDSDRVSVFVQPDSRTRLRLELSFDGAVVEAHASLESGDFGLLSACWPELQSRLWEQGVRIAPLTAAPASLPAWAGGDLPSRREHSTAKNQTPDEASQPVAHGATPKKRQAARTNRGTNRFDLWA